MINTLLSWLHLRQDALTKAMGAIEDGKQMLEAQQVTIEEQRELIDRQRRIIRAALSRSDSEAKPEG